MQYARAVEGNSSDKAAKLQALLADLANMEYLVRASLFPGLLFAAGISS